MSTVVLDTPHGVRRLYDPHFPLSGWVEEPLTSSGKWQAANPIKARAHAAVHKALRDGTLKRGKCEECGSLRVEAHHDDYDRPLDVRWLCRRHHVEHHVRLRRQQKAARRVATTSMQPETKIAVFKHRVMTEVYRCKLTDAEAARALRDLCLHYATKADIPVSDMIAATGSTDFAEEVRNGRPTRPR